MRGRVTLSQSEPRNGADCDAVPENAARPAPLAASADYIDGLTRDPEQEANGQGSPASRMFEPPADGLTDGIFLPDHEGAADRQKQNAGSKHKDQAWTLMVEEKAEKWRG